MKWNVLAHSIEIGILSFLLLYIFVLVPMQPPSQSSNLDLSNASLDSPPNLQQEIESVSDVLVDLGFLGCKVVTVSGTETALQSGISVDYSDFRLLAYNTELVFYIQGPTATEAVFFIIYQNSPVFHYTSESSAQPSEPSGGAFTRYEKLEFQSAYAKITPGDASEYTINLRLKNTGVSDATLDLLFLNAVPQMDCANLTSVQFGTGPPMTTLADTFGYPVAAGDSIIVTILLDRHNPTGGDSSNYKPGMSLEIMIQTAAGNQYPKVIVLP